MQNKFDFALPQRYRNTDPVTSKLAANEAEDSGRIGQQQLEILALVKQWPDSTSAELALLGKMSRHIPGRRLSELVDKGWATVSGKRPCHTNGRMMQTYKAKS